MTEAPLTEETVAGFREFAKIGRLNRIVIVTEKIDGTNACVVVTDDGCVSAQSRSQIITPSNDNFGFARWVFEHEAELATLGTGYHYGEWWGAGIQRRYGLTEKRFSLFNTGRWTDSPEMEIGAKLTRCPPCCHVVPVLGAGIGFEIAQMSLDLLRHAGSRAAPGFMKPEGVIAYHTQANVYFKATLEKDEEWKGKSK